MDEQATSTEIGPTTQARNERPKRKYTSRKRTRFQPPKRVALPVRALWTQASEDERKEAHELCMAMLEYWMGKKSKGQVARELGVKPLRVWQLSQLALSGMMAGLLRQPRTPRRGPRPFHTGPPEDHPAALKKRIAALEATLSRTEDLVRVLRTAPWVSADRAKRAGMDGRQSGRSEHASRRTTKKRGRAAADRGPDPGRPGVRASSGESDGT